MIITINNNNNDDDKSDNDISIDSRSMYCVLNIISVGLT